MLNTDFLKIDNNKLVGRLLPFWARGRYVQRLMVSILAPIATAYAMFREWAVELYVKCHVTFQKEPIEWYFKHRLGFRLENPEDSFKVIQGVSDAASCFSTGMWVDELEWDDDLLWCDEPEDSDNPESFVPPDNDIYVFAPPIREDPGYTLEDYERDIRQIMATFRTSFAKIHIIITNNQNDNEE